MNEQIIFYFKILKHFDLPELKVVTVHASPYSHVQEHYVQRPVMTVRGWCKKLDAVNSFHFYCLHSFMLYFSFFFFFLPAFMKVEIFFWENEKKKSLFRHFENLLIRYLDLKFFLRKWKKKITFSTFWKFVDLLKLQGYPGFSDLYVFFLFINLIPYDKLKYKITFIWKYGN